MAAWQHGSMAEARQHDSMAAFQHGRSTAARQHVSMSAWQHGSMAEVWQKIMRMHPPGEGGGDQTGSIQQIQTNKPSQQIHGGTATIERRAAVFSLSAPLLQ
jgi:hypothetical protein